MKKIKLLLFSLLVFALSGCYTQFKTTSGETYAQQNVVYIDYNFYCDYCYYEMYWCPACGSYHVQLNHWCTNHYYWYNNWYVVYYYHPYSYYYGHYTNHYEHRDYSRHYVRTRDGLRNYGNRNYITRDYVFKRDKNLKRGYEDTYKYDKRKTVKTYNSPRQDIKTPPVKRTYRTPKTYTTPPVKRNNTYKNKSRQQQYKSTTRQKSQLKTNQRRK